VPDPTQILLGVAAVTSRCTLRVQEPTPLPPPDGRRSYACGTGCLLNIQVSDQA